MPAEDFDTATSWGYNPALPFAIELQHDASKPQILNWYLNQISYADRYVGIEAASQGYFRKPVSELTLGEASLLAGVLAREAGAP